MVKGEAAGIKPCTQKGIYGRFDKILGRGDQMMELLCRIFQDFTRQLQSGWHACYLSCHSKRDFQKCRRQCIMAAVLLIQSVFLVVTDDIKIYFWIPCMIVAVFLMIVFIYSCCEITFTDAVYFGMIAFVVAEFMASFEWQVVCYFFDEAMTNWWLCRGLLVLIYGNQRDLYKILRVHMPKDGKMNISHREYISAALLIAVAVFAVSNISLSYKIRHFPVAIRLRSEISVH